MKIYNHYTSFDVSVPVATIGMFDGVHKGHVEILKMLNATAENHHGESVVITFWPHPRQVLNIDNGIKLLNTLEEKEILLEQSGVNHMVIIPFTTEFAVLDRADFVYEILVKSLKIKHLIIGYNHQFGKGREGNFEYIQEAGKKYGFYVEQLDAQLVENEKVSSTLIRNYIKSGEMETAKKHLGYAYPLTGKVVSGNKIGRNIGFPTANINLSDNHKMIPEIGVYAGWTIVEKQKYKAMVNIGFKPTVSVLNDNLTIEAHIIDFEGDIYDKEITILFEKKLRNEMKFKSLQELTNQLEQDKIESTIFLNNLK